MTKSIQALLRVLGVALATFAAALITTLPGAAQPCAEAEFAKVVDETGVKLRDVNKAYQGAIQSRIQKLADLRGWPVNQAYARVQATIQSAELKELDQRTSDLLLRFDQLSDPQAVDDPCDALAELKSVSEQLKDASREKASVMIARLDAALDPKPTQTARSGDQKPDPQTPGKAVTSPSKPEQTKPQQTKPAQIGSTPKTSDAAAPPGRIARRASRKPSAAEAAGRSTLTQPTTQFQTPAPAPAPWGTTVTPNPQAMASLPPVTTDKTATYTSQDIRAAGRGLFGTLSAELAAVIEHTVQRYGRPNGYILGTEGGGALIAGLRYGEGKLVLRNGGVSKVHWRGPSLGYDFGLAGSRVMFLVYNVDQRQDVYRRFFGVEGAAYVIGGVGVTFLRRGKVVLAPIRTGLGLRVGANVGYLKFSAQAALNPF